MSRIDEDGTEHAIYEPIAANEGADHGNGMRTITT